MFEFEHEKKIVVHVGIYFNFEIVISFYFPNQMSKNGPKYKFTFCLFIVFPKNEIKKPNFKTT